MPPTDQGLPRITKNSFGNSWSGGGKPKFYHRLTKNYQDLFWQFLVGRSGGGKTLVYLAGRAGGGKTLSPPLGQELPRFFWHFPAMFHCIFGAHLFHQSDFDVFLARSFSK